MRILIVEDEESLADLVATRLKKEKYIVDISTDGEETNGLYTKIDTYTNGEEITYNDSSFNNQKQETNTQKSISNTLLKVLLFEIGASVLFIAIVITSSIIDKKKLG